MPLLGIAREEAPPKDAEPRAEVTAVYGVTADDYLTPQEQPSYEELKKARKRRGSSRPIFDLPDVFYFIGGPIFLLILLRVLVIFIAGFEEKRKDEENHVASEHLNLD